LVFDGQATAVFAADATARLSGTVGVAVVTAGPGVTNTVTALKNAQMAESPLILIGNGTKRCVTLPFYIIFYLIDVQKCVLL
jgi:thiamine pyrophosphate-dependent acetolactate synthase large subunit-like protein